MEPDASPFRLIRSNHGVVLGKVLSSILNHLRQRLPLSQFTQLYGVPEASIVSSHFTIPAGSFDDPLQLPIGRACEGVGLFVLDLDLQPVPLDEIGKLYIGGVGLSSGYWRNQTQTDAAFIRNPLLRQRLFITDHLARIGFDGLIYLAGQAVIQEEFEDCLTDGQQRVDRKIVNRLAMQNGPGEPEGVSPRTRMATLLSGG